MQNSKALVKAVCILTDFKYDSCISHWEYIKCMNEVCYEQTHIISIYSSVIQPFKGLNVVKCKGQVSLHLKT